MITLTTLKDATAQEVFDQVSSHLLTQMKKSKDTEGKCMYRHGDLKCAAGCLISDDEYDIKMDTNAGGTGWNYIVNSAYTTNDHSDLISDLQFMHDNYQPVEWFYQLHKLSKEKGLEFKDEA